MPRALSLKKKTSQPAKEQPVITAFFKNITQASNLHDARTGKDILPPKTGKRKATSPCNNPSKFTTYGCMGKQQNLDKPCSLIELVDSSSNSSTFSNAKKNKTLDKTSAKKDSTKVTLSEEIYDDVFVVTNNGPKPSPNKNKKKLSLKQKNIVKQRNNCESTDKLNSVESKDYLPKIINHSAVSPRKIVVLDSVAKVIISPEENEMQSSFYINHNPSHRTKQFYDDSVVKHEATTPPSECYPPKCSHKDTTSPRLPCIPAIKYTNSPQKLIENKENDISSSPTVNVHPKKSPPKATPNKLKISPSKEGVISPRGKPNLDLSLVKEDFVGNDNNKESEELAKGNVVSAEMDSIFDDEWSMEDLKEGLDEDLQDLDLSTWQRCEISNVTNLSGNCSEIKLKNAMGDTATCRVEGIWNTLPLRSGDVVSVQAVRRSDTGWSVNDCGGILVLCPDVLLSSTVVVGAVFCRRKAVLQERFRGIDCGNKAMTVGILVHELLQLCLQRRLHTVPAVKRACDGLLSTPQTVRLLYDADMSCEEARDEMNMFVPQVVRFVDEQVVNNKKGSRKADEWSGQVETILDIEENICCPQLGVKGKIDVTLQVNINHRKGEISDLVPLELKTGRASVSAEHRGQLILYMMMMTLQQQRDVSQGLLLYLRDIITLKVVTSGYPEKRDLIMLRNQLAQYLAPKTKAKFEPNSVNEDQNRTLEAPKLDVRSLDNLVLPEPINHHACGKCAYLTVCSLYQWCTDSPALSEQHALSKLRSDALGHLSELHVEYFLRWTALLLLEDTEKVLQGPLHHIWTVPADERERRGRCLNNVQVKEVKPSEDRFTHTFKRPYRTEKKNTGEACVISVGDYVVVSAERRACVAAGVVVQLDADVVCVSLERDLTARNATNTQYQIDAYESQSQLMFNFTNLAVLLDKDERSHRLRKFIIDRAPATFALRLPREVGRAGARLLKSLNLLQQRAVLKAVAAEDYMLVHGMPGTGKTQTVVVLVQMLVALGKRVLVTAHTHSAVDNVLQRLPSNMRVLRLGSSARVSRQLACCTEDALTAHCMTPNELRILYDSMDVVGVTCLGSGHSLLSKTQFDVCIVDESTQVVQSTVLRPLLSARRFVLVGDPEQLPPVVRCPLARKLGMDESVFARLDGTDATVSLSAQYRMNARVASLANKFTYDGRLTCANDDVKNARAGVNYEKIASLYSTAAPWLLECLNPDLNKSVLVLDTGCTAGWAPPGRGAGDSTVQGAPSGIRGERRIITNNQVEALLVTAIVKALFEAGLDADSIGVITPYRDQVALLKKCVASVQKSISERRRSPRKHSNTVTDSAVVEVNTVDQYQGRDKSVIVYSCCKSWDPERGDYTVKDSEILEDKRRLTVAITRAKHKLILLGDVAALKHYSTFSQLFKCLEDMDREDATNSWIVLKDQLPFDKLYENFGLFF